MTTDALPPGYAALIRTDGAVLVPSGVADGLLRLLVLGIVEARKRDGDGGSLTNAAMLVLHALNVAATKDAEAAAISVSGSQNSETRRIGARDQIMTCKAVAALLGCTTRTTRLACEQGRLPAHKVGRQWLILEKDLDIFRFGKGTL